MRREVLFFLSNRAHSNGGRRQKRATEARASIEIEKAGREQPAHIDRRREASRSHCARDGHRFESPPLHQRVRANRRDFRGSEIARHFRSLYAENRSLRSGCHVQATLLGASRPKSLAANFRFQSCYAARGGAAHRKWPLAANIGATTYAGTGAWSPSARHWSGHPIGRSTKRLRPKPRGRRPSTAALTISGARKASDRVIRIERSVLPSREAIDSKVWRGSDRSSSSQRWASPRASIRIARALARIRRTFISALPAPWMISRLRKGEDGVQETVKVLEPASPSATSDS